MSLPHALSFLCRSPLWPGESLASLLVRLSALNAYPSPHTVQCIGQERLAYRDGLTQPMVAETYQVLQQLTNLPPGELYQATPHVFVRAITLPGEESVMVSLPGGETVSLLKANSCRFHLWNAHHVCYCPRCLAQTRYHRLAWMPCAATVCLKHRCLLLRKCQACHGPLRIQDVVKGQCPQCQFDLTQAIPSDITQDAFGLFAQTTLLGWFGLAPEGGVGHILPTNSLRETWHQWATSMPQQPPAVLYHLVKELQRVLLRIGPDWFYWHTVDSCFPSLSGLPVQQTHLQTLHPEMAYLLSTTAVKALVNWPQGFYAFLAAYTQRNGRAVTRRLPQDFGPLVRWCLEGNCSSPLFQFVQEAFDDYLLESYPLTWTIFFSRRYQTSRHLVARLPCMPSHEAAQHLQVPPPTLGRLVSTGFLAAYVGKLAQPSPYHPDYLCRQEVLALQQRWQAGIPQKDVLRLLGISEPILLDLVDTGMLTTIGCDDMNASWTFRQESVMKLLERLTYGAVSCRTSEPYIRCLSDMAHLFPRFGYRAATVMQLAKEERIRFGWHPPSSPHGGALWVSTEDLDFCLEQLPGDRSFISCLQFAHQMRVPPAILMGWVNKGLIPVTREQGLGWQFSRTDVTRFTARYVLLEEAATLLGMSLYKVQRAMKDGYLCPISGPRIDGCIRLLFQRADIEQWKLSHNR